MKLATSILATTLIALASAGQVYTGTNFHPQQSRGFTPQAQQYQQKQYSHTRPQNIPQAALQARSKSQGIAKPQLQQARLEQSARILSYDAENHVHNYQYAYETENGIKAQEAGQTIEKGTQAQGEYSYTGDDGQTYTVTYTADEFGFRPQGNHLPTPPPIPEAIAKALEQNAQDSANGIYDDGSYKEQSNQDYQQDDDYQQSGDLQQNYQHGGNFQQAYQQGGNFQQAYQQSSNYQPNYRLGNNYQFQQNNYEQQNGYQHQPSQIIGGNSGYHN